MKSLILRNHQYRYLVQSYEEYLQVLGYANTTVQSLPVHVRELLYWLEKKNVQNITALDSSHIKAFTHYIKHRSNKRIKGTALSSSSINKMLVAVNLFIKFLNSTGRYVTEVTAERAEDSISERVILSVEEIKQLYEATYLPYRENAVAMGQRDRAIIAVFYGCGLRRSEGKALDIGDIDLQNRLLLVRKGKGNKQRYVPVAKKHAGDIREYIEEGRAWFLEQHHANAEWHSVKHGTIVYKTQKDDAAFFLSQSGGRINEFYKRLQVMKERAEIDKAVTLHGLRHSIATHLLQGGMEIEEIAKFLGHGSLASTQIYTHIINEELKMNNE